MGEILGGAMFPPSAPQLAHTVRPLTSSEILHEGVLFVRQNRGFVGLRRWLTRYYVISRVDWTLLRYKSLAEAESPTRPPRVQNLRDVDYIRADGASRFLITLVDGTEIKLSGENSTDTRAYTGASVRPACACASKSPHPPLPHPPHPT